MLKIAICEDSDIQYKILDKYLKSWALKNNITIHLVHYKSSEEFLFNLNENMDIDIIILDIQMKRMNGIELAKKIREKDEEIAIIFVTGVSEHISKGYSVGAINYLLKPLKEDELFESLDRAYRKIKQLKEKKESLKVVVDKQILKIKYSDIKYFVVYSHYIHIELLNKKVTYKKKISDLEEELPKAHFLRCHRSYIVNLHFIKSIEKESLTLDDNTIIPISRGKREKVLEVFMNYFDI